MSNIHHLHQHVTQQELRLEQACDWLAKLDRQLSQQEIRAFQAWMASSSDNLETLFEVAKLWDKMDDLSRLSDLFPDSGKQQTPANKWYIAMAASVLMVFSLVIYQFGSVSDFWTQDEQSSLVVNRMNYQTQVGETNTINLPDNSKIVLNTNSFVQVKYTQFARVIDLQRGEIHIDVAHDKSRPLSVIVGGKVIQAVGTAFNVEVRNKLIELIVTDGKVLVAENKHASQDLNVDLVGKRLPVTAMAISKGEKVDLDLTGLGAEQVIEVDAVELAASLSWRQGNLIFRGERLADAMAEISRYTEIEFELADDHRLEQVQVAGMFKTGDVNGLLDVLNRNFNISSQRVSKDKIMLSYAG